ncbi:unnamed protein product [Leuciscus chuanchicus]
MERKREIQVGRGGQTAALYISALNTLSIVPVVAHGTCALYPLSHPLTRTVCLELAQSVFLGQSRSRRKRRRRGEQEFLPPSPIQLFFIVQSVTTDIQLERRKQQKRSSPC